MNVLTPQSIVFDHEEPRNGVAPVLLNLMKAPTGMYSSLMRARLITKSTRVCT